MGNCFRTRRSKVDNTRIYQPTSDSTKVPCRCSQLLAHSGPSAHGYSGGGKPEVLPTPRSEGDILSSPHLKAFRFNELKNATRNFLSDSLIGQGGFGNVYKGWIDGITLGAARPGGSEMVVAVKKLKAEGFQGHKEWLSELNYLGQLHHPNLVKLIGYCLEGDNRLLVYEYMPNGSLENHLFRRRNAVDKTKSGVEHNLVDWARPYLNDRRKLFRIMDTKLEGQYPQRGAYAVAILAFQCISEAKVRPQMSEVLAILEQLPVTRHSSRSSPARAEEIPNSSPMKEGL
ncbi:unnamed protein product [Lupinus luteus]|uniref:non-specific serine/threonine protein kinase n=1 Tax=Lupinus luteus TaxID=3873 RepID=A0AAV1Y9G1_LUPLU